MKWLLTLSLISSAAFAQVNVGQDHVESMLQQMVRENVISAAEAEKAKVRMKSRTPEQGTAINSPATQVAARMPASTQASNNKIEEVNGIDLDGAQFKAIQSEVRKIVPQYKD